MLEKLASGWWKFALRGLFAIIFGIVALIKPDQTLQILILAFGAFALMDGTLAVFAGISLAPFFNRWWAVLLQGIVGIIIGLATFFWPSITAIGLYSFIGAWAIITGLLEIVSAIQYRQVIADEWTLVVGGVFSIIFGVLMFVFPLAGAVSLAWLVSVYAIAFGFSETVLSFRLYSLWREAKKIAA